MAASEPLPLEVLVLSDGEPSAAYESVLSATRAGAPVRVLERNPNTRPVAGASVEACDWQDDRQAATATAAGRHPLVVLGAGEQLRILDDGQVRAFLTTAAPTVVRDVWTPNGWEVRLTSPGPGAIDHIGATTHNRIYGLDVTAKAAGATAEAWRRPLVTAPSTADPMTFVVAAPGYHESSAGIVALHVLCDRLNHAGHHATLCALGPSRAVHPGWCTPPTTDADLEDAVVVYPEIIEANPLGARRVVRWLLNRPGYVAASTASDWDGDLVMTYSAAIDPGLPSLCLPVVDPGVFFPKDVPGAGALLWTGKGTAQPPAAAEATLAAATEITRTWPPSKTELAALLRQAGVLYSLDSMSALNLEATLCGTPVVLFPDERWDRATIERHDAGTAGLGWYGEDDVETVRRAAATAYDRYTDQMIAADQAVHAFADRCREFFAGRKEPAPAGR